MELNAVGFQQRSPGFSLLSHLTAFAVAIGHFVSSFPGACGDTDPDDCSKEVRQVHSGRVRVSLRPTVTDRPIDVVKGFLASVTE